MKLVVLGATGGTGMQLVQQSLAHGHAVTAFVRNAAGLREFEGQIKIVEGNVLDRSGLARVLSGHDAVISGFGPRIPLAKADAHLLETFAEALTAAMQDSGVCRAVMISTAFLFKDCIVPPVYLLGRLLFPTVVRDSEALEAVFQRSNLNWTLVRPPELTNGPATSKYRIRMGHLPRFGFRISRADVADYFVRVLDDRSSFRHVVGVSY
jgi:putative NADH-flavin reductase